MITSGWQSVVKFAHLISKKGDNNKFYVKFVFWKVFKSSIKLLTIPIFRNVAHFLYSKGAQRSIGHPKVTLWTLQGQSGTRKSLGHSGIQGSSGTWILKGHFSTWVVEALEALYLADSTVSIYSILFKLNFTNKYVFRASNQHASVNCKIVRGLLLK